MELQKAAGSFSYDCSANSGPRVAYDLNKNTLIYLALKEMGYSI